MPHTKLHTILCKAYLIWGFCFRLLLCVAPQVLAGVVYLSLEVSGSDVMIYYWDERDGVALAGWWFGPKVGSDQVWAYNPDLQTYPIA